MQVARAIGKQTQRVGDVVARVGGEEFSLLLPETDEEGAAAVAEHIHAAIHELALANNASPFERTLTVSIGVVTCVPVVDAASAAATPRMLIEASDRALYRAKTQGRNRTVSSSLK